MILRLHLSLINKRCEEIKENESWNLKADQGYYVIRGGGSMIAFRTGTDSPIQAGVRLIGAHTDSPNLRLKHRLAKTAQKHVVFDIEPYGVTRQKGLKQ